MIKIVRNKNFGGKVDTAAYSYSATAKIRKFHQSLTAYKETPLVELKTKNIGAIYLKDESQRFGLKAFKALGGIWAMHKIISESPDKDLTFITTTDGNHGKGISWAAAQFGCKSFVYMPKGTVKVRAQAIRDAGSAQVTITDLTYDECVKYTADLAAENHWHLIQDTSWAGYEEIPFQIMRGYTTFAYEAINQMPKLPTHIFLQAGVGSMAGAVAAVFAEKCKKNLPRITVVEPETAGCFYETFRIGDGKIHSATGNGQTMMAGLNCGTPCALAWEILKNYAADTAIISDDVAAEAMRTLATRKIISGESGCAGFALADTALDSEELRRELELDANSIIFVINTEGATDPDNYARITADI